MRKLCNPFTKLNEQAAWNEIQWISTRILKNRKSVSNRMECLVDDFLAFKTVKCQVHNVKTLNWNENKSLNEKWQEKNRNGKENVYISQQPFAITIKETHSKWHTEREHRIASNNRNTVALFNAYFEAIPFRRDIVLYCTTPHNTSFNKGCNF